MARELMLLVATAIICVAPGIHGTHHLSFAVGVEVSEITRTGCGETKLCIETPADCDPKDSDCMFASIVHNTTTSPTTLTVALCGESTGFIAMGLTRDLEDTEPFVVFVCAQNNANNGAFFFRTQKKDSEGNLTPETTETMTPVTEIRGSVDGDKITCEFNIPDVEDKMHVILGSGTAEAIFLDVFNTALESGLMTVTDPTGA